MDNELEKYLIYHNNLLKKKKKMEQFLNLNKGGVENATWILSQIRNNINEIKKNNGKTKNLENMLYNLTNQYIDNTKKLEYHKKIYNFNLEKYEKKNQI